jgi:hypothetical protein
MGSDKAITNFLSKILLEIDSNKSLFFGDARNDLIKMAYNQKDSYLSPSHVISLIAKLLDTKRNYYAESFNTIFATLKPELIKSLNLDKHIVRQTSTEGNDGCFIVNSYLNYKNMTGTRVEITQLLSTDEAVHKYNDWYEKRLLKAKADQTKYSKSVVITAPPEAPSVYQEKDGRLAPARGVSPTKNGANQGGSSSFLKPIQYDNSDEEGASGVFHDFNNMPSIKKTKSFKIGSINENLKGKQKRFSVMKIIPDEVKEQAKKLAQSLAESTFLEQKKKMGESIFSVPPNFERVSKEIMVDRELITLRHYIFTIQACRT